MFYHKDEMWDILENIARNTDQPYLAWNISHAKMNDRFFKEREREQLKKEITEDVLSRISAMFETGEAVKEINSLNKALEQLGK